MQKRTIFASSLLFLAMLALPFSYATSMATAQDLGFDDRDAVFDGDAGEEFGEELGEEAAEFEEETEDVAQQAESEWEQFWDLDDHGDDYYTDDWYEEDGDFDY